MKLVVVLLLAALCFVSAFQYPCSKDKSTYTNCDEIISKNIFLNITVDFNNKRISGYSEISATKIAPTNIFTLDTRHLKISAAALLLNGRETPLSFNLVNPEGRLPVFGTALNLQLPSNTPQSFTVRVYFVATNESETIQFLEPQQTAGGVYPYLFTQSESIHSRSMFPCQDTPSVKATFNAYVSVPQPLVVVMSGNKKGQFNLGDRTIYTFEQPIPIPSYLIAMGVGALVSGNIGPRSNVWTEKEFLDAATFEFADTEKFIAAAESFLIPYEWKIYDLLLLPPSFPFGGMENPQLTFVTPTLLAGDRSLANVIAHEISHSWSGNLVTNQNWEDFWLNEGFTVYSERRITGIVKGEPEAGLGALIGLNELKADIEAYNATGAMELTQLIPTLDNVSPEDAFSSVPYEKGFNFLFYLASLVGRENFDKFLEAYFTNFKYSTVNHNQMKNFFLNFFATKVDPAILDGIEWDKWFYTTGMPYKANKFDTSLADAAVALAQLWVQDPSAASQHKEFLSWSSNQKSYFLDNLVEAADSIDVSTIDLLESVYALSSIKNAEIRFRWEMLCLKKSYSKIYQSVVQFVTSQGRMKFVRPLYRALFNAAGGKQLAIDTFVAHRGFYHPIAAKMIAQDLGIKKQLSFRA